MHLSPFLPDFPFHVPYLIPVLLPASGFAGISILAVCLSYKSENVFTSILFFLLSYSKELTSKRIIIIKIPAFLRFFTHQQHRKRSTTPEYYQL
jgi:hypothetical protein